MAEVYEMMMKIGLHGGILTDLGIVAERLTRIHGLTNQIGSGFSRWNTALVGIGSVLAGAAILGALTKAMNMAKGFNDELARLKTQLEHVPGLSTFVSSGDASKLAFDIAQRQAGKVDQNLKYTGLVASLFGKEGIEKGLPELTARASNILQFSKDYKGNASEDMMNLLRAGEATGRFTDRITGQVDPKLVEQFYSQSIQAMSGSHGTVTAQMILGFAKQAGFTARDLSAEGFMTELVMSQVLGGQRVGTATIGIYNQLSKGLMTKKTAQAMEGVGLLKPGEWSTEKNTVKLDQEASKRLTKTFAEDPMKLSKIIMDNLDRMGITDPSERLRLWSNAFGRQTTQRFEGEMATNYNQMLSERARWMQGGNLSDAERNMKSMSISYNLKALSDAWNNFIVAVAGPNSENYIKMLQFATGVINSWTLTINSMDSESLKNLGLGIAALGIALVAGGMVAVLAAIGPMGWLIGGFIALAAINWDKMKGIITWSNWIIDWMRTIDQWSAIKIPPWMQWNGKPLEGKDIPGGLGITPTPPVSPPPDPNPNLLWGHEPAVPQSWIDFFKKSSFDPGKSQKQILQPVTLSLNLDGRTLGQAVSEILEDLSLHPTGPPEANGWDHFRAMGAQDSA